MALLLKMSAASCVRPGLRLAETVVALRKLAEHRSKRAKRANQGHRPVNGWLRRRAGSGSGGYPIAAAGGARSSGYKQAAVPVDL